MESQILIADVENYASTTMVDWNDDGSLDLLASLPRPTQHHLLFRNTGGPGVHFAPPETIDLPLIPVIGSVVRVLLADADRDGYRDFLMLSGDWHPIHCDEEYAKTTPLGRRIANGTLGITLALGSLQANLMHVSDPLIAALGIKEWNYKAPIFVGDTLHIELEVADKRLTKGDRYIVERLIRLINQNGTLVQEGRAVSMWQRQKPAA